MALIEMEKVTKTYQMGEVQVQALCNIDLMIKEGEFLAVWGPSGSGKTTLLNLLGAIDEPCAGRAMLAGQDIHRLNDDEKSELRSNHIGFVFQHFNLIPVLDAVENVMLPLQIKGVTASKARKRAFQWLAEVDLTAVAHHRPDKMSGGQRQRVAIARALVTNPSWVVADEPTANLDSQTALNIIDIMYTLNQQRGTTFIFSTHDHRLLNRVSNRVALYDGKVSNDGQAWYESGQGPEKQIARMGPAWPLAAEHIGDTKR